MHWSHFKKVYKMYKTLQTLQTLQKLFFVKKFTIVNFSPFLSFPQFFSGNPVFFYSPPLPALSEVEG